MSSKWSISPLPPSNHPELDKIFEEAKGKEHFPRLKDLTFEQLFSMPKSHKLRLSDAEKHALTLDYWERHHITPQQVEDYVVQCVEEK